MTIELSRKPVFIMGSVSSVARYTKRPSRFLTLSDFDAEFFDDGKIIFDEKQEIFYSSERTSYYWDGEYEYVDPDRLSNSASTVGLVVDYMSRFLKTGDKELAFEIPIRGSKELGVLSQFLASFLLDHITGLNEESIICACKLVQCDAVCRAQYLNFYDRNNIMKNVDLAMPNDAMINNILIFIERTLAFYDKLGDMSFGFTMPDAYTDIIQAGDGDFMTVDTVFDLKTSKRKPTPVHCLQVLIYYLMGRRSSNNDFKTITKIGFFNPRLNAAYTLKVDQIDPKILNEIDRDVIGYTLNYKKWLADKK